MKFWKNSLLKFIVFDVSLSIIFLCFLVTENGMSALQYAESKKDGDSVKFLVNFGAATVIK